MAPFISHLRDYVYKCYRLSTIVSYLGHGFKYFNVRNEFVWYLGFCTKVCGYDTVLIYQIWMLQFLEIPSVTFIILIYAYSIFVIITQLAHLAKFYLDNLV